ncbi:MAG TPA: PAS domain-containing sensor histidine kinase [Verrucomicrobiae bacterium]|nr:PAS domain-containing sensor histidine kinase [Verrucomicrobiae bacterium]
METSLLEPVTEFAAATRVEGEELQRQVDIASRIPRLNELYDAVADIVLILNRHRQIVYANKTVEDIFKLTDRSVVYGLRPGEALNCQHCDETPGGCGTTRFCSQCGAVKAILSALRGVKAAEECHLLRNSGTDALDLRVVSTPFKFENELFTICVATDISQEKRLQVLERTFLHDISNTLTVLTGVADFAAQTGSLDDDELIRELHLGVQRMTDEVNGHKELLAAENGDLPIHPSSLHSLSVLQEAVDLYRGLEIARTRTIQIDLASANVPLSTDRTQLTRILGNMLKNALEASPPGAGVWAGCEFDGDSHVSFWVKNSQVMPREVQLQVFNRSFSTKGSGRGIGTYSIKLLCERYLQGKASFVTSSEAGTTFKVTLPLALD